MAAVEKGTRPLLNIKGLTAMAGELEILKGIDLDVYKGGFVRYGKVNKKKILGYIELIESQSMDLTDCDLNKD